MSVQFVLGPSGAGKTEYLMKELIAEADKNSEQSYLYIVPEQFTMEAQRDIVRLHPKHGTMNIDAIGLNRLAYRVFDELSVNPGQVLEDFGKSMIIRRIITENKDSLLVYGSYGSKLGFVDEMKSMMSELFQFAVDKDTIDKAMEELDRDGALFRKLHDIKLIYEKFNEHNLRDNCIVAEQLIDLLAKRLDESELLRNSHLYIDGFTGFTKSQLILLERLMGHVRSMTFAFTIDSSDGLYTKPKEYELFRMTKETVSALTRAARNAGADISDNIFLCDGSVPYRFRESSELAALERNLFRYPHKKYDGENKNICVVSAASARAEAVYVASRIRQLVRDEGYRYSDIAVVAGDLDSVAVYYKHAMDEYGIPVFIDANVSLAGDPCTDTIRAFLRVMSDNFSFDGVFRLLKSGMIKKVDCAGKEMLINISDVERLENYALKMRLRGYSAWSRRIDDYEWLENTRAAFMSVFSEKCIDTFKPSSPGSKASVREYTEALYEFISRIGVFGKLEYHRQQLYEENRQDEGDAYVGIFDKVIALFDKVVLLLGDERMTVREYADILDAGMADMKVGTVPPTVDRVVVGDMTRSRLNHVKVLLFAGVNEGIIPRPVKKGRILTAADRDRLEKHGVELAPSDRTNAYIEQFYIYTNLTKPQEKLFLIYRRRDDDMKAANPSYLIDRVKGIFPGLSVYAYDEENEIPETCGEALGYVIRRRQEGRSCLGVDGLLRERRPEALSSIAAGGAYNNVPVRLSPETVKKLYGENMSLSVSRLEKFAECQYKYFLQYGLGLKERDDGEADAANIGTILHSVMQNIFLYVRDEKNNDWAGIDEKLLDEKTSELAYRAANEEAGAFFADTSRAAHMMKVIEEIALSSVHAMKNKAGLSNMKPMHFELSFDTSEMDSSDKPSNEQIRDIPEYRFKMPNGMNVSLKGVIDRIDECKAENGMVYEIVDYKSSEHKLDEDMVLAGLQMQLVTYAAIAGEYEKRNNPDSGLFGMMYFELDNPMSELDVSCCTFDEDEGIRSASFEADANGYHPEEMVYRGMYDEDMSDRVFTNDRSTFLIKSSDKKESELIKGLMAANKRNIERLAREMSEGGISMTPVLDKKKNACAYCDYKAICLFDTKYSGNSFSVMDRSELEKYKALKESSDAVQKAGDALKKLGEKAEKATEKFEKQKEKLCALENDVMEAQTGYDEAASVLAEKGEKATKTQKNNVDRYEKKLDKAKKKLCDAQLILKEAEEARDAILGEKSRLTDELSKARDAQNAAKKAMLGGNASLNEAEEKEGKIHE